MIASVNRKRLVPRCSDTSGFTEGLKEELLFFDHHPLKTVGQLPPRLLFYPLMINGELMRWQVFKHIMAITLPLHY